MAKPESAVPPRTQRHIAIPGRRDVRASHLRRVRNIQHHSAIGKQERYISGRAVVA
jgi:hypothetical protein